MATLKRQAGETNETGETDETKRIFEELAEEGHEWVSLDDVARRAMKHQHDQRRLRRSRLANSLADYFLSSDSLSVGLSVGAAKPRRVPLGRSLRTQAAAGELEAAGRLEHRFIDDEGRLRKDPPGRRDYRDRRYRLIPETTEGAEVSPQDRFENIARRIENLPGSRTIRDGEGQESTKAIVDVEGRRLGLSLVVPEPVVRFHMSTGYLPVRDGASEREPRSILVTSQAPGEQSTHESLSVAQLVGGQAGAEALGSLDAIEDTVTIVELAQQAADAEGTMTDLYERSFASPALADSHIM